MPADRAPGPTPDPASGNDTLAIVLAAGDVPRRADLDTAWPGWADGLAWVVAADAGAAHAATLGLRIDEWVGDGDSIDAADLAALVAAGVPVRRLAPDKDESDTEVALLAAIASGAARVALLGGLGGVRVDHALANLGLLEHPALRQGALTLYDAAAARITLVAADAGPASWELRGRPGDLVSLLPLGGPAEGVATSGLRFPLSGEALPPGPARGLSNVRTAPIATVSLRSGRLVVIETPASLRP